MLQNVLVRLTGTDVLVVVEHMSTYWAILEKMPGSKLRLTKFDDDILAHFNRVFPDFDLKATINEDDMKSKEGKEKWRNFINEYENKVEDFNFGTMLRANPTWEYGEKETIFGMFCTREQITNECMAKLRTSCAHAILCCRDCAVCSYSIRDEIEHLLIMAQKSRRFERLDIREVSKNQIILSDDCAQSDMVAGRCLGTADPNDCQRCHRSA